MSQSRAAVNPCAMCMPLGSVLVFRGIEGCMPLFHGSQGCSTYMRLYLAHHFREPVDIASSALSEKAAVYGGAANLKTGLKNVIRGYGPRAVGVSTTCLAETIGDDVERTIREFLQEEPDGRDIPIIPVSTPSYAHSHEEGYSAALLATVRALAQPSKQSCKLNLLVGSIVSPSDVRNLKRLLRDMSAEFILLPDISQTFDLPLTGDLPRVPAGGTPLEEIRDSANSRASITVGACARLPGAGEYLEEEFGVPHHALPLPIGLQFTDMLMARLEEVVGLPLPESYEQDRGRLLDAIVDAHKLLAHVKTAVYGDSEMVLGILKFMVELGMSPRVVATGTRSRAFATLAGEMAPQAAVLDAVDFSDIGREISARDVELMVGPFTGRQIAAAQNIPLLRVGFPNHDRFGASRQLLLGYQGAAGLVDAMANALLEHRERIPVKQQAPAPSPPGR
ncbi:MAG: nitrogenase associated protein N [Methanosarcinales archaeon]|nr:nitrogenase associated protein N [Methanosarcinales archaeon]